MVLKVSSLGEHRPCLLPTEKRTNYVYKSASFLGHLLVHVFCSCDRKRSGANTIQPGKLSMAKSCN